MRSSTNRMDRSDLSPRLPGSGAFLAVQGPLPESPSRRAPAFQTRALARAFLARHIFRWQRSGHGMCEFSPCCGNIDDI